MSLPGFALNRTTFPEKYEECLVGPLFRPWAEITLDALNLAPGDRILDIACGTGIVARIASERLGNGVCVAGIDINPDMLAVGRRVAPHIDWREGNASNLPLRQGEQFDVVVCQQGVQFFPDKPAALLEMRRALAPGGRLAVSAWRSDEENPFFRALRAVAEERLGAIEDQRHSFGNAAALEELLAGAGFQSIRCRTVSLIMRFDESAPFLQMNSMALVSMSAAGKRMTPEEKKEAVEAIVSNSVSTLERYRDGSGVAFELRTNLATAAG